jgi:hypothetical protein
MSRRYTDLDLFWVMSDQLTSEDELERQVALLAVWSFYADRYRSAEYDRLLKVRKRELKRLSRTVWSQLLASGLLEVRRVGVLWKVRDVVDGVAYDLLGDELFLARRWFWDLSRRIVEKRGPSTTYQLRRDREAGLSEQATRRLIAAYLKGEVAA